MALTDGSTIAKLRNVINDIMNTHQPVNDLITQFEIQNELKNAFQKILLKNNAEDLDIENKDISINSENIEYSETEFGFHRFQTPILKHGKVIIGYFVLVVTNENERMDEYFVINQ